MSETTLKPCPYCGRQPVGKDFYNERVHCVADDCFGYGNSYPIEAWNTRPIEDALRQRIAELEARWIPVEERVPDTDRQVVVASFRKPENWRSVDRFLNGHWIENYGVTHWMELPAMPEVKE